MKTVGGWDIISKDRNRREGGVKKEGRQADLHHVHGWWMGLLLLSQRQCSFPLQSLLSL